ncbi:MAG: glucose-1-phosphate cytidylyltransferase [Asgard group archaeon]|nr:glucose-1-phosphate cytidylyltransferase [Asgard group archaeon]
MKVVILCGGKGTRLREETAFKPKPLVDIGGKPILWHIMKIYSHFGYNDFILCLGYKGSMIKEYFLNYDKFNFDFTLNLKKGELTFHNNNTEDWNITFAFTGDETNTGGRIKRIEKYIEEDTFLATYGDGVADININELIGFHNSKKLIATLTGFHPTSKYGILDIDQKGTVTYFQEKPVMKDIVSGGFFVFDRKMFDYLDDNCILEREPLENLVKDKQLSVYIHKGFWGSMDTYKDVERLNNIWEKERLWKIW